MAQENQANQFMDKQERERLMKECAIMLIVKRMKKVEVAQELGLTIQTPRTLPSASMTATELNICL